ncbi:hypothetical protein MKEN_01310700 [Mycena kentingensis (nom. inval.)]|nr:hypothetical protein MKEN_01310700 [Mycena kentingensis (nom. inval.)]
MSDRVCATCNEDAVIGSEGCLEHACIVQGCKNVKASGSQKCDQPGCPHARNTKLVGTDWTVHGAHPRDGFMVALSRVEELTVVCPDLGHFEHALAILCASPALKKLEIHRMEAYRDITRNEVVDEFDHYFGSGAEFMELDLPEDCALSAREAAAIAKMNTELDALSIGHCVGCREEGFDVKLKTATLCRRCDSDNGDVRKWSDENNTNPSHVPPQLQYLTDLEEMLISRVKTVMQVRYTKGRQLCYKDHIVNLPQNIVEIATKLPRLPEEVDMVIIRRESVDLTQHVDYVVRREKVRDALLYKMAHDPAYADLQLDEEALSQLPENASVYK